MGSYKCPKRAEPPGPSLASYLQVPLSLSNQGTVATPPGPALEGALKGHPGSGSWSEWERALCPTSPDLGLRGRRGKWCLARPWLTRPRAPWLPDGILAAELNEPWGWSPRACVCGPGARCFHRANRHPTPSGTYVRKGHVGRVGFCPHSHLAPERQNTSHHSGHSLLLLRTFRRTLGHPWGPGCPGVYHSWTGLNLISHLRQFSCSRGSQDKVQDSRSSL